MFGLYSWIIRWEKLLKKQKEINGEHTQTLHVHWTNISCFCCELNGFLVLYLDSFFMAKWIFFYSLPSIVSVVSAKSKVKKSKTIRQLW